MSTHRTYPVFIAQHVTNATTCGHQHSTAERAWNCCSNLNKRYRAFSWEAVQVDLTGVGRTRDDDRAATEYTRAPY